MEQTKNEGIALPKKNSKIVLTNKNAISISGITKVLQSTENLISVVLGSDKLDITGKNLTTNKLDVEAGILEATGDVFDMKFAGHKQKENFFKRIFG